MNPNLLVLIPLALGHLSLFVLAVNVVHALGHRGPVADRFKLILLAGFTAGSGILAWEASRDVITAWSWLSLLYGSTCVATGLVFFPLSTALLHLRAAPGGITGLDVVLDLVAKHGVDKLVGSGRHAWLLRLPGNESLRLRRIDCQLTLRGLPPDLDGLSVLHVSDVHFSPAYNRGYFEAVFAEAVAMPSDLVIFTGDVIDHDEVIDWIEPLFSKLRGTLGSFSILGNHDLEHHPELLRRRLENAGFTDLEGGWAAVNVGKATVALGGTSFPWGPLLPLADRMRADYRILLSHSPDRFYWAERSGFDLMFSGHNHGGQVRLPVVGAVFMPSVYSRRFDRGFFRKRKLTLHVSQGVAGKHPIRYGCPPEITRLVLRSEVTAATGGIARGKTRFLTTSSRRPG